MYVSTIKGKDGVVGILREETQRPVLYIEQKLSRYSFPLSNPSPTTLALTYIPIILHVLVIPGCNLARTPALEEQ